MKVLRVALNVPLPTLFDYACDDSMAPAVGARVRVPFRRRESVGYVIEHAGSSPLAAHRIKKIAGVFGDFPPLSRELLKLAAFLSTYYQHPFGEVLFSALPLPL